MAITSALNEAGIPATDAATGLWDLERLIGAPTNLSDVGFDPAHIEEAAELIVAGNAVNPRPVDTEGTRALLAAACRGERPA